MMAQKRAQSAMEYLMTYGWAILVIAVVLGALYSLGLFGNGNLLPSTCLANPGFFCSKPVINSTGALNITIGQLSGSTILITSLGCSNTTSAPQQTPVNTILLVSGESTPMIFHCPISANMIGTTFTGSAWIGYTASGIAGQTVMVAKISTAVGTGAKLGSNGAGSGTPPTTFTAVCGGTLTVSLGNDICTFTSSGTFTVTGTIGRVAIVVVAGGGGAGGSTNYGGGGGGAGGFIENDNLLLGQQAYSVTIGAGGSGGNGGSPGGSGGSSSFGTISAVGGGGGAGDQSSLHCASSGGSGGGGDGLSSNCDSGGSGTSGQGNSGGNSNAFNYAGGGGGGYGGAGGNGAVGAGGNGGNCATSMITGAATYYSAGGGGGFGGSGACGISPGGVSQGGVSGGSGTPNTGSGGGGSVNGQAGPGGSGVVVIVYNALGTGTP